jgi:uncharacterized membrane protein YoaK (UPF0700 family)
MTLLSYGISGANINAQTEETQETALTLACCGGFTDVADFLIKAGADIELGASTPLMEAAQEGHMELVKYLLSLFFTLIVVLCGYMILCAYKHFITHGSIYCLWVKVVKFVTVFLLKNR